MINTSNNTQFIHLPYPAMKGIFESLISDGSLRSASNLAKAHSSPRVVYLRTESGNFKDLKQICSGNISLKELNNVQPHVFEFAKSLIEITEKVGANYKPEELHNHVLTESNKLSFFCKEYLVQNFKNNFEGNAALGDFYTENNHAKCDELKIVGGKVADAAKLFKIGLPLLPDNLGVEGSLDLTGANISTTNPPNIIGLILGDLQI